jgi:UDP-N-acetylglucosamine acyltransferase
MSEAYAMLFGRDDTLAERIERVAQEFGGTAGVNEIVEFVRAESARALCRPRAENGG